MKFLQLVFLLFCIIGNSYGANVIRRNFKVYPALSPIVIDGRDDDLTWQKSSAGGDFMLLMQNGKRAVEKTEFKISYDSEFLYCFFKMYESNMQNFTQGPPPDVHDRMAENEAIYIYLKPDRDLKGFFLFAASPMGAKTDKFINHANGGLPGIGFDCYNWQLKTGRFAGGWTVECAIPLSELAIPNKFNGTINKNEQWTFNVCRMRSQGEFSQYYLTGSNPVNYGCFGALIFCGNEKNLALQAKIPALNVGKNEIFVAFENQKKDDRIKLNVLKDNKIIDSVILNQHKNVFTIPESGEYRFVITAENDNKIIYKSVMQSTVINKKAVIEKIFAEVNSINAAPALAADKSFLELKKAAAGKIYVDDYDKITKMYENVKYPVFLNSIQKKHKVFTAFVTDSDKVVMPFKRPDARLAQKTSLALAGNEIRSIQLLLVSASNEDENIELGCDFGNAAVGRFYEILPDPKTKIPDILSPVDRVLLKKGEMKSVWIDVIPNKNCTVGNFNGKILLKNNRKTVSVDVDITLLPFALPETTSLRHNHWLRRPTFKKNAVTPQVYEKALQTLALYRSAPFYFDMSPLRSKVKISYSRKDGFVCDFSALDIYFELGKKYHANSFWSAMSCNVGSLVTFVNPKTSVFDKDSNKRMTAADIPEMRRWLDSYAEGKPHFKDNPELAMIRATGADNERIYFDTNPLYKAYLRDLCNYLAAKNMLQNSYYEVFDEAPQLEQRWLEMIKHCSFIKKEFPRLRILNFEVNPTQKIANRTALGICDVWAPQLDQCSDELVNIIQRRIKNNPNEEFWFYVCRESVKAVDRYTPYVIHGRPNIGARIIPYFAWKFQVKGIHVNDFTYQRLAVWDGKQLLPTMRLAQLRDGMADYEYFALLKSLRDKNKDKISARLLERIDNELKIEQEIIKSLYQWTKSADLLDSKKLRLAALINELLKDIKK